MTLSGCQALEGCERKAECQRYQAFLESTPYRGWNAHQLCITLEYIHFIPIKESE